MALGTKNMLLEWGLDLEIKLHSDASAAIGIARRKGVGRIRHIEVTQLWLQDKVKEGRIHVIKVHTKTNQADALTKHVSGELIDQHVRETDQIRMSDLVPIDWLEINSAERPPKSTEAGSSQSNAGRISR